MDKHLDEGSERLLGQGWVLGLAGDVGEVVPGRGPEPQHRGHRLPVGEGALVLAILTATCRGEVINNEGKKDKAGYCLTCRRRLSRAFNCGENGFKSANSCLVSWAGG